MSELQVRYESSLSSLLDSNVPVILVNTNQEEDRFLRYEIEALKQTGRLHKSYRWDSTRKLIDPDTGKSADIQDLREVINWFVSGKPTGDPNAGVDLLQVGPYRNEPMPIRPTDAEKKERSRRSLLFVLDATAFMPDPGTSTGSSSAILTRTLKNVSKPLQEERKTIVLIGNSDYVPPELQHVIGFTKFPLPNLEHMRTLVKKACSWFARDKTDPTQWLTLPEEQEIDIATLLLGFRSTEAEQILARSVLQNSQLRAQNKDLTKGFDMETIRSEKVRMASNTKGVELVLPDRDMKLKGREAIGGSGPLIDWFDIQSRLFTEEARRDGIRPRRGAVIYGPGGTGKDWTVERLAEHYGWNVLRVDIGSLESKWQGESQDNLIASFEAAERCTPCFYVISEFEKMFGEAFSGGVASSGTQMKMYASFLNWMQRKKNQIFVWGLTNEIEMIPGPALRAGRFNRIWFQDLPNEFEREQTISVQLRLAGWDLTKVQGLDFTILRNKTEGFSNAEIADGVNEGLIIKHIRDGSKVDLNNDHLVEGFASITPLSKIKSKDLANIRQYAKDNATPVANSDPSGINKNPMQRRRIAGDLEKELE